MTGDPEGISILRLALAFAVVSGLLGCLGFGLKYMRTRGLLIPGLNTGKTITARMQVIETLALDMKRRLVIVRCDEGEHLLLLGEDRDIVVDTRLNENQLSSLRTKSEK